MTAAKKAEGGVRTVTSTPRKKRAPELARCRQLAERADFDLRLAHDVAVAFGLPFVSLSKLKRARREMSDLLRELETADGSDNADR